MKGGVFLDYLRDCQLLKKDSVSMELVNWLVVGYMSTILSYLRIFVFKSTDNGAACLFMVIFGKRLETSLYR